MQAFRFKAHSPVLCHYSSGSGFNCAWLRYLSDVRSLSLDCLRNIEGADRIAELEHLEAFVFGVFESDIPELLRYPSLARVHKLILATTRKNNIDLAPLGTYQQLEDLFLNAHARNIATLGDLTSIQKLSLSQIAKSVSLRFVGRMEGLRSLTLLLGGRTNAEELAHPKVTHLEVLRVRGLAEIDLSAFPQLQVLRIADQLQLRSLELSTGTLIRWLSIWNCKNLSSLLGLGQAVRLNSLSLGRTSVEPESVFNNAPSSLKRLIIAGYGRRRDEELENRIRSKGYTSEITEPDIGGAQRM
jgi:protein phosphatase 1 regulatory subunit 7